MNAPHLPWLQPPGNIGLNTATRDAAGRTDNKNTQATDLSPLHNCKTLKNSLAEASKSPLPVSPLCKKPCPTARSSGTIRRRPSQSDRPFIGAPFPQSRISVAAARDVVATNAARFTCPFGNCKSVLAAVRTTRQSCFCAEQPAYNRRQGQVESNAMPADSLPVCKSCGLPMRLKETIGHPANSSRSPREIYVCSCGGFLVKSSDCQPEDRQSVSSGQVNSAASDR